MCTIPLLETDTVKNGYSYKNTAVSMYNAKHILVLTNSHYQTLQKYLYKDNLHKTRYFSSDLYTSIL